MQPTREFLENEYVNLKTSIKSIAKKLGYTSTTGVHYWLNKYNINKRNQKPSIILTKDYLEEHYNKQKKSAETIAKELNLRGGSTVIAALKRHHLTCRPHNYKGAKRYLRKGYKDITGAYWWSVKNAAKVRNLDFNISIDYIWNLFTQQNERCALSGIEIKLSRYIEKQSTQTASLDRIDSSKGYVIGNIQWVHKDINKMKQNFNETYFIDMCTLIAKNRKKI